MRLRAQPIEQPVRVPRGKIVCRNFRHLAIFAHEIIYMPIKHTFFKPKYWAIEPAIAAVEA
jgi:hypothetical protein